MGLYQGWLAQVSGMSKPKVLEIGTKQWGDTSHHHRRDILRIDGASWDGLDLEAGTDVTIISDLHTVADVVPPDTFDAVLCTSVLEHVRRPWVAAVQLASICKRGALLMLQTHQTFPYHPYPHDYYRFSREGLAEIFAPDHGWRIIESEYEYPCQVVPKQNVFTHARDWNFEAESWLNVSCIAERIPRG